MARWNAEAANAAAAHSYGAKVFGTDWGAAVTGWDTNGTVWIKPQYFQAQAEWLALAGQYHHLDWVSPANEPDYGWQQWNANGYTNFTTKFGSAIGLPLIEAESFNFSEPFSQTIADNPNVANYLIPIAAGHGYGATPSVHSAEIAAGKRVWMTENTPSTLGQDNISESIQEAQNISQYMNNQFNAYVWWWMYDTDTNLNFVDESGNIHKNGYTMGQFAKWIRPGSTCVSATYAPQANVNVTAYNVNGSVVIVAVNANGSSVNQQFNIYNSSAAQLEGYQTSASLNMADIGTFALSSGSFTASLPAQSITTFVQTNAAAPSLPSSWTVQDIGSVGIVGSVIYTNTVVTNGVFTLTASGTDIWNTSDAFRFVYATNGVNCTITARVSVEQSTNPLSKAGVMIRDSLNANAANAFIGLTASNGVVWQFRSSDGGGTTSNSVTGLSAPYWVQLVESGNSFTGNYSADGITWTQLGTATISMGSAAYTGLAFCNNGNTALGTATFDNVGTPGWPIPPPAVPTGLAATAGVEQATLSWQPVNYATTFIVGRATVSGGPYTTVATVRGTGYLDTGLVGGTNYYYVVSATNSAGRSANTAQVSAMATTNIMSPWQAQDIGTVGSPVKLAGSESFTNGVFTLTASGADIWGTADAFRFVYVPTNSTSFTIVARVDSVQNIDPWSKAGVMIRDSLNSNAANAFIAMSVSNGVTWQSRTADGGTTVNTTASGLSAPYWVKLTRNGSTFTGYRSPDGVNWTQLGTSATITMPSTVYVGLGVTAHNNTLFSTSAFDQVTAPGWSPTPASMPMGLTATGGVEQATLSWQASINATSYNVYRSTTSGRLYTLVANVTTTNYADIQLASSTTYYYVVTAANSLAGESANSAQVSAATTVTVPAPWVTQDIGAPAWGSAFYTNGVFTVNGAGADIWNTADSFRFVSVTTNSANFTMIARVASVQNANAWSKAGVMIRDSLNPGAANAFIAVTPGNGVTWQYRSTDGGNCNNATTSGSAPYWVELVRSGSTFTGYCSANGTSWTLVGSTTLTNITTAYVGLAVTSHNNPGLCKAVFDNVSGVGWPLLPGTPGNLSAAAGNAQVTLNWSAVSGANSYNLKSSTNNGGPYALLANVATTNYINTGLINGTTYFYVVTATNIAGESAASVLASATPQAPPNLIISQNGANFVFSWPVVSAGFTLQSSTNLAPGNWMTVTSPAPQIVGGQWQLALPPATNTGSVYYRLMK